MRGGSWSACAAPADANEMASVATRTAAARFMANLPDGCREQLCMGRGWWTVGCRRCAWPTVHAMSSSLLIRRARLVPIGPAASPPLAPVDVLVEDGLVTTVAS